MLPATMSSRARNTLASTALRESGTGFVYKMHPNTILAFVKPKASPENTMHERRPWEFMALKTIFGSASTILK